MRSPGFTTAVVLSLVGVIVTAEGLRCYVCNSKADSRCADPIQAAEDSNEEDSNNNNNINNNNKNSNSYSSNNNNNYNNRYDEPNDGLRMVDCKVAHSVRQAMDAVSGLLSRLGQRSPGGGDVWAAVRSSAQGGGASPAGSGPGPGHGSSGQQGGLLGDGQGRGQSGGQGGLLGQSYGLRGYDEQEPSAACHKVDMTVDGELVTDRGCAPGRVLGQEPCEALAAALGDPDFCELCDGDGCNASALVRASVAVVAVALAAVHVLGHVLEHGGVPSPQHQWGAC